MKNTRFQNMLLTGIAPGVISGAYGSDNTLTNLIPELYEAVDVVSRELVGFIPSCFRNASAERAAVDQTITYDVAPKMTTSDLTPSMQTPEPSDHEPGTGSMKITKAKGVDFGWTGKEELSIARSVGRLSVQAGYFAQGLRALTNEVEQDLAVEAALGCSRLYGVAGTTPFASNTGETAQLKKMLDDNGAPLMDRSLVIDTSAGAALRTLGVLTKANEAGTDMTLRQGELLDLNNFSIKESGQAQTHIKGTAASSTTDNAGYSEGDTVISLASAGTGTVIRGDGITFAGDSNIYAVAVGNADVSAGGTVTLAEPGLRQDIPATATAVTVIGSSKRSIAMTENALHLVARAPELPSEGDSAIDRVMLLDERSGMVYEVSLYAGYRKIRAEVALAWGVHASKSEHMVGLLG